MSPELHGLAILYAAAVLWTVLFAASILGAASALNIPNVVTRIFTGPRWLDLPIGSARFQIGVVPFPLASAFQRDPNASNDDTSTPELFGTAPLSFRIVAVLSPYVLLTLAILALAGSETLRAIPRETVALVRGALSPLGEGDDLARGFLRRLASLPLQVAIGRALAIQFAIALLPSGSSVWFSLLNATSPRLLRHPLAERILLACYLLLGLLVIAWFVAIGRVLIP